MTVGDMVEMYNGLIEGLEQYAFKIQAIMTA